MENFTVLGTGANPKAVREAVRCSTAVAKCPGDADTKELRVFRGFGQKTWGSPPNCTSGSC